MAKNKRIIILFLSLIISALIVVVSLTGILNPDLYSKESLNWKTQSIAQDKVDLFLIVPTLLITSTFIFLRNKKALLLWSGVLLYLIYTFIIYCFAVHFNQLYPVYCLILGLCFYSLVYFFLQQPRFDPVKFDRWTMLTGIYFLIIAILFCFLWLSEILPAILKGETPSSLTETGLPVNPVHSIDLALFLPGLFLVGINLIRKKSIAFLMAPIILVFFILMNLSIAFLALELEKNGIGSGQTLATIMVGLALISKVFLLVILKKARHNH